MGVAANRRSFESVDRHKTAIISLLEGSGGDVLKWMLDVVEAFGVADEEVAAGLQLRRQTVDEMLHRLLVEVNHDVAAEDDLELADLSKVLHQVEALKVDEGAGLFLDEVLTFGRAGAFEDVLAEALDGDLSEAPRRRSSRSWHG